MILKLAGDDGWRGRLDRTPNAVLGEAQGVIDDEVIGPPSEIDTVVVPGERKRWWAGRRSARQGAPERWAPSAWQALCLAGGGP